ncbi:unnamed protein product [Linum tenue]|uniref:SCP domain-containing protein n=2 Tax=Linum tenue TaxID=586396 RepID=A0AAV0JI46_9ROSI|nr:unnamed protein product [Linum tenue]
MSPPLNLLFPCLWILCLFLFNPTAARTTPPPRRQDQIRQYLEPHNRERSKLGIPPLKWSKKLADFAASWAHTRQGDCELIHSGTNYGENLFWGSGQQWSHGDAVAAWAAERCYYDHAANSCRKGQDCLHYTQMVWRQSSRVGCARVVCKSGDTFVGCNYDPPGNVVGEKPF